MHRLLVVVVLLLAGCSAGSDPDTAAPPAGVVAGGSSSAPSPRPAARTLDVTFAGGEITGVEGRVDVAKGEQLVLRVTSDIVEEIHVHGYDLYVDLVPGQTARLAFEADLQGSYEVELHDAGRPLFQLRVS